MWVVPGPYQIRRGWDWPAGQVQGRSWAGTEPPTGRRSFVYLAGPLVVSSVCETREMSNRLSPSVAGIWFYFYV